MNQTNKSKFDKIITGCAITSIVIALFMRIPFTEFLILPGFLYLTSLVLAIIGLIGFKSNQYKFAKYLSLASLLINFFPLSIFILMGLSGRDM